ncbi:MAG: 30S ribosomal protein S6 [Candidatus Omnitrophota bacterium]|nr:MAG: 30S ribosomal protein S6 [Candidatus Omnitrophota bacterium]
MIRSYESMMIFRPDLGEEQREEMFQKIIKKIEGLEGKVLLSNVWASERSLYYPLRSRGAEKKKYSKGSYWCIQFSLDTEKLADLKETIRLEERILRNIIVRKETEKTKA